MSDSDEWASASDSELQDIAVEPEIIVKSTKLTDQLPQNDITDEEATVSKIDTINKVDNIQISSIKSTEEINNFDVLASSEDKAEVTASDPPPYELNTNILEEKQITTQLDTSNLIPSVSSNKDNIVSTPHATGDQAETPPSSSWSSWGSNWLSKAANSVASSAHNIASKSEIGISSIVTGVESRFGIPTPESIANRDVVDTPNTRTDAALSLKELAQKLKEEQTDSTQVETVNIPDEVSGLQGENTENNSSDKQDAENIDESTGFFSSYGITLTNKIVSGGLDTLENIGKKTIGLISEGDPGLRNKRAFVQEQIDIITKDKPLITDDTDINEQIDNSPILTSFHTEFEQLQGYVYLEAMEILSSECEAKQRLKMHSVSTRQHEEGATPDVLELTEEMFEISFESEIGSCELGDLLPSCKGLVNLERVQQTVRELEQCYCSFDNIDLSSETLLPQLNSAMKLIAIISSQFIQIIRKVSELYLARQVPVKETLSHTRELALIAYKSIDKITTRIASIKVSDDVIGNKFILDMNSGVTYIQDSFSLLRSILKHGSSS
ncbi:hypothetical protein LOD99_12809 [Oopsacas minuta]|uniref:Protein FAM114A2 n=1 Tax=Oopsacas minuta TaxID=111878 RepID=A0AAV7JDD6_9METZ|nr:hypothetical protein LOD99_12809 [Oopsacas minuta]